MKIAFWSNVNEKCGVSSNLAAITVASVIRFPYHITVLENQLKRNNLGYLYQGLSRAEVIREVGNNYYEGEGIEALLRRIYRNRPQPEYIREYMREIIKQHLYYIPQGKVINKDVFEYEFNHNVHSLLSLLNKKSELLFIDTTSQNNLSSKAILEEANLIIVNLCQDPQTLEDFFRNYSSLIPKALFLIGNYNSHSIMNLKRISKLYEIPMDSLSAIPYNDLFELAIWNGSIVEFITRNYDCKQDNPNYMFMQAVKRSTYMIMKKAHELGVKRKGA